VTLPLKREFMELVRRGVKRSTVRAGARNVALGQTQLVSGNDRIAVAVTGVERKTFADLDDVDAATDGFESVAALRSALLHFYPDLKETSQVTIVHFDPV
jgi:hypothetical protein